LAAVDAVFVLDRHAFLAVNAEKCLLACAFDDDLNLNRVLHDQRTMGKRMRAHRRDYQRVHCRHQDRTAGSQRVGRGSSGRRDNDAIALVIGYKARIEVQVETHQARDGALVDHNIVERVVLRHAVAAAEKATSEHGARFNGALAVFDGLEGFVDLGQRHLSQEPQRSKVDAQDGYAGRRNRARRSQQRAVTAQHEHKLRAMGRDFGAFHNLRIADVFSRFAVHPQPIAVGAKPFQHWRQQFLQFRLARLGNDGGGAHREMQSVHQELELPVSETRLLVSGHERPTEKRLEIRFGGDGETPADAESFFGNLQAGGGLLALVLAALNHADDVLYEFKVQPASSRDLLCGFALLDVVLKNGIEDFVRREHINIHLVGAQLSGRRLLDSAARNNRFE